MLDFFSGFSNSFISGFSWIIWRFIIFDNVYLISFLIFWLFFAIYDYKYNKIKNIYILIWLILFVLLLIYQWLFLDFWFLKDYFIRLFFIFVLWYLFWKMKLIGWWDFKIYLVLSNFIILYLMSINGYDFQTMDAKIFIMLFLWWWIFVFVRYILMSLFMGLKIEPLIIFDVKKNIKNFWYVLYAWVYWIVFNLLYIYFSSHHFIYIYIFVIIFLIAAMSIWYITSIVNRLNNIVRIFASIALLFISVILNISSWTIYLLFTPIFILILNFLYYVFLINFDSEVIGTDELKKGDVLSFRSIEMVEWSFLWLTELKIDEEKIQDIKDKNIKDIEIVKQIPFAPIIFLSSLLFVLVYI